MANPTFGPLLTGYEVKPEIAKAARNFTVAVLAARFLPKPLRDPVLKYGLGLGTAAETGAITAGPAAFSNLLPAPFGFAPAETFGLAPNFYLPNGIASELPTIIPGVKEQRAEEAAEISMQQTRANAVARLNAGVNYANFGDESLTAQKAFALGPLGKTRFADPAATAAGIDAELARRQIEYAQNDAERLARLGLQTGGLTVPVTGGGQFVSSGPAVGGGPARNTPIGTPPAPVPAGGGGISSAADTPPPPGGPARNTPATPTTSGTGDGGAWDTEKRILKFNQGPFTNGFRAIVVGDP